MKTDHFAFRSSGHYGSLPETGDFVSVRARRWLVERAEWAANRLPIVDLACIDDDVQGEPLQVLWDAEIAAEVAADDVWESLGADGSNDAEVFAAFLRTLKWRTASAADRRLFQAPFRAGDEVVGVYKETTSGVRHDRAERRKVMALAQRREIDAVLVTELSRWGRSTTDLLATLRELEARQVSLVALNGMAFDLSTPYGRMLATVLAGIAEFERELTQERIRSGIAAAKARGKKLGRQPGQRPKSNRLAPKSLTRYPVG